MKSFARQLVLLISPILLFIVLMFWMMLLGRIFPGNPANSKVRPIPFLASIGLTMLTLPFLYIGMKRVYRYLSQ